MSSTRRTLILNGVGVLFALAGCSSSDQRTDETVVTPHGESMQVEITNLNDNVEYIESNDSVRYVSGHRSSTANSGTQKESAYEVIEFEKWAASTAAEEAAKRVRERVTDRLGQDSVENVNFGVSQVSENQYEIAVFLVTVENRSGDTRSSPTIEYERIAEVVPREVKVTYILEERRFERTYKVSIEEEIHKQG